MVTVGAMISNTTDTRICTNVNNCVIVDTTARASNIEAVIAGSRDTLVDLINLETEATGISINGLVSTLLSHLSERGSDRKMTKLN